MRAALVGASDFNGGHFAGECFDFVVAVDGGFAYLRDVGVAADVVVGDFDSLGYVPEAKDVRCFPPEKDESDLELACRVACEAGCDSLVLYGCLGRRFDHTLAVLQVMVKFARRGIRVCAVGDEFALAVLCGDAGQGCLRFAAAPLDGFGNGMYRNYLSAFAYGGAAAGVCERGLKYALDDATVPDDVSLGLSNEFTGAAAEVRVRTGCLVVTFPLAAWEYLED
ncbi:MAG: thiamine diphosphokinase [Coriobacteriia bacterium]|nr:thiamine diphosphokinase [Coriobacteriia bacterium]